MNLSHIIQKIILPLLAILTLLILSWFYFSWKEAQETAPMISYCPEGAPPIIIAEPNWDSAELNTAIVQKILEDGFDCDTEIIPGGTTSITKGLIDGRFDITTEMWVNTAPENYIEARNSGVVRELGNVFTSEEGWYVPRYLVEGPDAPLAGLTHVDQLAEYAPFFALTSDEKPVFHNCVGTWFCKNVNDQKLEAYGLTDIFINKTHTSAEGLDSSIAGAFQQKEPWIGYYWAPTKITSLYDLVKLEEDSYSDSCWADTKACAYPTSQIILAGHGESLDTYDPVVISFFEQYSVDAATLQKYLGQDDLSLAAEAYLNENQKTWSRWVPANVAKKLNQDS